MVPILARIAAVALSCALFAPEATPVQESEEEFSAKVKALVEQLRTGPAAARKKAEEEIVKLGSRAVPILRTELARAEGDVKGRLEAVIQRIERDARRRAVQGKALTVKIAAKDQPLEAVASEWKSATGFSVDLLGTAGEAKVTLDAPSLTLWVAVDRICKANGKLSWDVSDKGVVIDSKPYSPPAFAMAGGYVVVIRDFEQRSSDSPAGKRDVLSSGAYVAGPPGTVLINSFITYDALVDDRGANLLKGPGPTFKSFTGKYDTLPEWDLKQVLYDSVKDLYDPVVTKASTKVKMCRGSVYVRAVMDYKKAVELRGPAIKKGAKVTGPGIILEILENTSSGSDVRMEVVITDTAIEGKKDKNLFYPESGGRVILRDARGADIGAKLDPSTGSSSFEGMGGGATRESTQYTVTGTLKGEGSLSSFEIWDPSDIEETKVPFDLKDIPIKKSK